MLELTQICLKDNPNLFVTATRLYSNRKPSNQRTYSCGIQINIQRETMHVPL